MENKSSSSSGSFCKKILGKLHRVTRGSCHPQHINPTMTTHGDDGHHHNTKMNPVSAQQYSNSLETTHILKPANNTASGYGGKMPINYENDSTQTPPLPPKNGQVGKVVSNTDFTKFIKQTKKRINRNYTSNAVGDDHWENEDGGPNFQGLSSGGGGEDSFGGKDQFSEFIYQTKRRINRKMSSYGGSTSSRIDSINNK